MVRQRHSTRFLGGNVVVKEESFMLKYLSFL